MIISFANKETRLLFEGGRPKGIPSDLIVRAFRKLRQLNRAAIIEEMKSPPSNRLEKLHGDREGQWSVRVNDQWRICFVWNMANDSENVELVDYH